MSEDTLLARAAFLLGDPARSRMLAALMSGQARTASELALDGAVAPSTASRHLAQLVDAGLLVVARQGRHRYFRLAGAQVAAAVEAMMGLAPPSTRRVGPADPALRRARVCYDHLAGDLAIRWRQQMEARGHLLCSDGMALSASGAAWCAAIGIDVAALRASRRPLCRPCLDWSERRDHVAGALGSAMLGYLLDNGLARRVPDSRAVQIGPRGERFLSALE
ncbi:winged helix-turn-helix domain-containing protein [Xanthomonas sp. 3307]|uniref:ArsR/SmtB family transcription factor n=1 Tax=Xanthomonas sp. 3307 TaxID=3035316 RepID=UPI00160A8B03|nr:winged helix-turn-helix domain-containing protein [Xanthomonas sp. 3307]MBB5943113.1 DNA-binding transcriptional ArsR family regulator [Xanthomonas sp. 3307]